MNHPASCSKLVRAATALVFTTHLLQLGLAPRASGAVVITEVLYDSVGVEFGTQFSEWIEIYNTGPGAVDLTGWSIEKDNTINGVGADLLTFVQGSPLLGPGQFALIVPGGDAAGSTAPLLETWHIPSGLNVFSCNWTGSRNLGNGGETIALRDSANVAVDTAAYPDLGANLGSVQVAVSALSAAANDGASNWVQSSIYNAAYCEAPVSTNGGDFGYFDSPITNDFWDGPIESRDLGTPGRFPTDLKYHSRYSVDYGGPVVSTRQQVRDAVIAAQILPSPNAGRLCAYDFPLPFPAGTRVNAAEGRAPYLVLPATTWVVWLDDDPLSEFNHAARIVLVDDATLAVSFVSAGWWPEINGEPYFGTEAERNCNPNNFWRNCCQPFDLLPPPPSFAGLLESEAAASGAMNNACAIAISGSEEKHFTHNANNFIQGLVDKGLVSSNRTKKVLHPASKLKNICKALDDLPDDCDKVYFYIATHGSRNSLSLPGTDLSAKKLACKLKDLNASSYCIVIQACKSGSHIDELEGKKITGTVTTSADTNHNSKYKANCYSFYTKYLLDCLKLETNSTLKDAAAWAKKQHKKERPKDDANPQCRDLQVTGLKVSETNSPDSQCHQARQSFLYQFETEDPPAGPVFWSLAPPGIPPPGLMLTPDGTLAGFLQVAGQFDFTVQVTDLNLGEEATLPFTLCVLEPLLDVTQLTVDAEVPQALLRLPYQFRLGIQGGTPPYTVQVVHGALPPDFTMVLSGPDAGLMIGTAMNEYASEVTLQVMDSSAPFPQMALRDVTFEVVEHAPPGLPQEYFFPQPLLPPPDGEYRNPFHAVFPNGVVLKNASHRLFSDSIPPPPPGGTVTHSFNSIVAADASLDAGANCFPVNAPALVAVELEDATETPDRRVVQTEMLSLDISGGGLPPGVLVRENPVLASEGLTTVAPIPGGFLIGSAFDLELELSMDNGSSWMPMGLPARVELRPPARLHIARVAGTVTVSWPAFPDMMLQSATSLQEPITWQRVTQVPGLVGTAHAVVLAATDKQKFFRLAPLANWTGEKGDFDCAESSQEVYTYDGTNTPPVRSFTGHAKNSNGNSECKVEFRYYLANGDEGRERDEVPVGGGSAPTRRGAWKRVTAECFGAGICRIAWTDSP
jgi:hypothetical protein